MNLDNNPIGSAGAAALMLVPINVGSRCKISAEKCNTGLSDSMCWFSHSNPLGRHRLDLSRPYERAVAFALIHLVMAMPHTSSWKRNMSLAQEAHRKT